jgi:hypothetical protein
VYVWLNITTEDGELLERVNVELTDDIQQPLGSGYSRSWILTEIENAARIVLRRAQKGQAR